MPGVVGQTLQVDDDQPTDALSAAADQAVNQLRANGDPDVRAIGDQLAQANSGFRSQTNEVQRQLNNVTAGLDELEQQLKTGDSGDLQQQLARIDDAIAAEVKKLREGIHRLNSGAQELSSGMAKLKNGSGRSPRPPTWRRP